MARRKKKEYVEYVFVGKNYFSEQRAKKKVESLEGRGYKLTDKQGRKLTYKLVK